LDVPPKHEKGRRPLLVEPKAVSHHILRSI
jgi:hypothetical protein